MVFPYELFWYVLTSFINLQVIYFQKIYYAIVCQYCHPQNIWNELRFDFDFIWAWRMMSSEKKTTEIKRFLTHARNDLIPETLSISPHPISAVLTCESETSSFCYSRCCLIPTFIFFIPTWNCLKSLTRELTCHHLWSLVMLNQHNFEHIFA